MRREIKVLLIEDDEDDFVITSKLLKRIEGTEYDVDWVKTYDAGFESVLKCEHDICLLDYRLGEQNGIDFLREVREKNCKVPIILLTGQGDREIDMEAAKAGATDYMVKGQISESMIERSIRYSIENKKIEQSRDSALEAARQSEQKYLNALIRQSEEELNKKNEFLRAILENLTDAIVACDADGNLTHFNQTAVESHELNGVTIPPEEWAERFDLYNADGETLMQLKDVPLYRALHEGKIRDVEMVTRSADGKMLTMITSGQAIIDKQDRKLGAVVVMHDITERKRVEEQLQYDAFHDGLTGLANRALFMDHVRTTIKRRKSKHAKTYAVLFLDFDRFKIVNDSLGHAEGDKLLKMIAERLQTVMRTGDLLARLGGDEFVILLTELLEPGDALRVAQRIQDSLESPFGLAGREIIISTSIGIAFNTADANHAEEMLRHADIAMYRAKAKGKAQYQVFDEAMHQHASKKLQLETEMRQALERGEFKVHYQPIIHLETNRLDGFEALVRWKHPTRGMVSPVDFIPMAEETGLILPLGKWILYESCRQLREWQEADPLGSSLTVSVNLSAKQFSQFDLPEQVAEQLEATGLNPRYLKLEITESHIMEDTDMAIAMMNRLRDLGIRVSLDDFGTGYSSLSYLHRLPIDYLKIDRSFVSRMVESQENAEIVSTIVKLAQNLKMQVVAEGIETADQLAQLNQLNCEYGQGYFFSKPLNAEAAGLMVGGSIQNMPPVVNAPPFGRLNSIIRIEPSRTEI
jgi:diguanylate cyclase (GGDEF)-like protein